MHTGICMQQKELKQVKELLISKPGLETLITRLRIVWYIFNTVISLRIVWYLFSTVISLRIVWYLFNTN